MSITFGWFNDRRIRTCQPAAVNKDTKREETRKWKQITTWVDPAMQHDTSLLFLFVHAHNEISYYMIVRVQFLGSPRDDLRNGQLQEREKSTLVTCKKYNNGSNNKTILDEHESPSFTAKPTCFKISRSATRWQSHPTNLHSINTIWINGQF